MSEEKKQPAATIRDGSLKVSIWENEREGQSVYSAQFRRTYRDQEGQMRDTDSFFAADLLKLSRLAGQSYADGRGVPGHGGIKPDRQRAAALERFVIGWPVAGLVGGGCRSAHAPQLSCWNLDMNPLIRFVQHV